MRLTFKGYVIISFFLLILSSSFFVFSAYSKSQKKKDPIYNLKVIVQTGSKKEALKSMYLAELLNLSVDKPVNYFSFNEKEATAVLLKSPLIKKACVKKIKPATVYVDYEIREPIAKFQDYKNLAVDKEGFIFPLSPFFSPRNLPEIYLHDEAIDSKKLFSSCVKTSKMQLALSILDFFNSIKEKNFSLKKIDLSNLDAKSYGRREMVITLEHSLKVKNNKEAILIFPHILRLGQANYKQQVLNYFALNEKIMQDYRRQIANSDMTKGSVTFNKKVIDLRINKLAFIDE